MSPETNRGGGEGDGEGKGYVALPGRSMGIKLTTSIK